MQPNESDQLRLERHEGHSARSPIAHIDEFIYSAQAMQSNESDQLRLERHQGHNARIPVARLDELIHSAQATQPNESDQLRLERHQGHSARSPVAHFDELCLYRPCSLRNQISSCEIVDGDHQLNLTSSAYTGHAA